MKNKEKPLKLFIWDDINFGCVLAHDLKEAHKLITEKMNSPLESIFLDKDNCRTVSNPEAFYVRRDE